MADQERPSNQQYGISPENMPPLEPTAEVPPVNSDKLNDPQYWNDKYQGKTANVPVEHRDDASDKPGIAKKVIASLAGVAVLGGGAFVGIKTLGGDSNTDRVPKDATHSYTVENPTDASDSLTPEQQKRHALKPDVARNAMLELAFEQPGGKTPDNVDRHLLTSNLNTLLHNITYMEETGDFSIMSKTFYSTSNDSDPSNYPVSSVEVQGIETAYLNNKRNQDKNPDQPVSYLGLENITDIKVPAQQYGNTVVDVYATVMNTTYGNPDPSTMTVRASNLNLNMKYSLIQVDNPVGDSGDTTEKIWVIFQETPMGEVQ